MKEKTKMKPAQIQFRVNAQDKKDFIKYCEMKNGRSPSEVLQQFVIDKIREYHWFEENKKSA